MVDVKILEGEDARREPVRRSVAGYQETGDPHALLQAAVWAMHQSDDVPREVAMAFQAVVHRFESGEARTLDEALGVKRPDRWRQPDYRQWRKLSGAVYREVCRLHEEQEMPIDENTFREAGKQFNVSGGQARNMYYAWRDGKQNERGRSKFAKPEPFKPKQVSDATIRQEWARDSTLRQEFNNEFEDYRAYRRAVAAGVIWVNGRRPG